MIYSIFENQFQYSVYTYRVSYSQIGKELKTKIHLNYFNKTNKEDGMERDLKLKMFKHKLHIESTFKYDFLYTQLILNFISNYLFILFY